MFAKHGEHTATMLPTAPEGRGQSVVNESVPSKQMVNSVTAPIIGLHKAPALPHCGKPQETLEALDLTYTSKGRMAPAIMEKNPRRTGQHVLER